MEKKIKKQIANCVFAITQNRKLKLMTILELSGEKYEGREDLIELSYKTDEQLNVVLLDIINYILEL